MAQPYRRSGTPEKRKMKPWKKVLISVSCVLLALIILLVSLYFSKLNKMDRVDDGSLVIDTSTVYDPSEDDDFNDVEPEQEYDGLELPEGDIFADDNIINILLLGTDERSANFSDNARADSIMILSFNKDTGKVKLVSLQRAIAVPIPGRADDWLTHSFRYGGAALTQQIVEECFLIELAGYVRVNFNTFSQLVDSVGGVDIELTALEVQGLNGEVRTNARTDATVTVGLNRLSGHDALEYSRLRYIDSDWNRIVRQRNVIKAAAAGMKGLSVFELNSMLDDVLPLVQTNLSTGQITSLLFYAPNFLGGEIEDMSIPVSGSYYGALQSNGQVLNVTDFTLNSQILHEFLSS